MRNSSVQRPRRVRRGPSRPPIPLLSLTLLPCFVAACATAPEAPAAHGRVTTLSAATTEDAPRCQHRVPREVCARCNPALIPKFHAAHDWCDQHGAPESQCFACHPDLTFDPLPPVPAGADLAELSKAGEDVPDLAAHAVRGKVTLFDFYAVWCAPCRKIDAHVAALLGRRADVAVRKLNVVSWETPLAARYLKDTPALPFLIVYGKDGRRVRAVEGLDLEALDRAIDEAARP